MQAIFLTSILCIAFPYFGYPLILMLIGIVRKRGIRKERIEPAVTIIITAFNEEKGIAAKIENTLKLEYPSDKLEVMVASDGSTDATNAIVREYEPKGIRLLAVSPRQGKENAQKHAVEVAKHDFLVFTDVATHIEPHGLKEIVGNFADPSVGCVSGEDRVTRQDGKPAGEGMYVRYEMWLRRLESRVNSLVGLSGSFFAARKEVCRDFSTDMQSDFRTLLNCVKMGMRGVCDPQAIGHYPDVSEPRKEMERKSRTVVRGLTVFFRHRELLNFFRYGFFSFQLVCHKLIRWLVPLFMVVALASNFVLSFGSYLYLALFGLQFVFYLLGAAVHFEIITPHSAKLRLPSYFLSVNVGIIMAWWRFLRGERVAMWEPSKR